MSIDLPAGFDPRDGGNIGVVMDFPLILSFSSHHRCHITSPSRRVASRHMRISITTEPNFFRHSALLEDLAIGPLVCLALDLDGLVPRPLVLHESLVLGLAGVKLGEFIALKVWGDIEGSEGVVTTDHEGALDDRVVGNTEHGGCAEEILSGRLETSKEAP